MRILILLNFFVPILLGVTLISSQRSETGGAMLATLGLMLASGCLVLWNLFYGFTRWKAQRIQAFYPAGSLAAVAVFSLLATRTATRVLVAGTPRSPDSFLNSQTKSELEAASAAILGHGFKHISADPSLSAQMIAGHRSEPVPPEARAALVKFGFHDVDVDDAQSLVTFHFLHGRSWSDYTYATDDRVPLGTRGPSLSEVDVEDWSELVRIAKQGDHATADEARRMVFGPAVVYPYLVQTLGRSEVEALSRCESGGAIPAARKQAVLDALNQQASASSGLVESREVTYDHANHTLHLCGCARNGFWVVRLMDDLLANGTLIHGDDEAHLRIRRDLSEVEQRKVAWLHVGLMNFLYGNFFKKAQHLDDRPLGDGWYFKG